MTILVTGGAGYIGSHMVLELNRQGYDVVVLDSLITGHKQAVNNKKLYIGELKDKKLLEQVFTENKIDGVIHFAASSLVGESVTNPSKYYENNLETTRFLLDAMKEYGVKNIVFSSSAAVFGQPEIIPITEDVIKDPTNPYGETKLAMEKMLHWYDVAYGIKFVALRYFNAAGADISGEIGEDHQPETHLLPIVLDVVLGKREAITIFGNDYNTNDGTCVRDYVHVTDLANAHILALEYLKDKKQSNIYNLGSGQGYSVKEVIDTVEKVTGVTINRIIGERRAGDPDILVASSDKIKKELGWAPKLDSLEKIVDTAWTFKKNHPNGY